MRSAIEIIARSCSATKRSSSGSRAIVPSSFTTSASTPAGERPARRARSTAASVWPARLSTPPSRYRNGKMCPGRARSSGRVSGSMSACTVVARSAAEMPVVVPRLASTETVNAVRYAVVFSATIIGSCSSSRRVPSSGMQTTPLVWRTMKPIVSGVVFSAAMIRSPSFSRLASSTTTTASPRAIASIAFSISVNGIVSSLRGRSGRADARRTWRSGRLRGSRPRPGPCARGS